jgi:hypothetical protein
MVSLLGIIAGISLILAVIVTGTVVGVCLLVSWLTRGARPGSVAPGRPRRGAHGGGAHGGGAHAGGVRVGGAPRPATPVQWQQQPPTPGPLPGSAPPWPPQNSPGAPVAPPRAHR